MEHGCGEPAGTRCDHRPDISCSVPLINCPVAGSRLCSETRRACDLNPLNGNECPNISNRCEDTSFGQNGRCSYTNAVCNLIPGCPDIFDTCLERGVCTTNYTTVCAKGAIPSDCPGAANVCVDDYGLCLPYKDISGYAYIENAGGEAEW